MEHVLLLLPDGTLIGVHSDDVPWREVGRIEAAPRLSSVEFDPSRQEWVAIDLATGEEIASGPDRSEVLRREAEHYNRMLEQDRLPVNVPLKPEGEV